MAADVDLKLLVPFDALVHVDYGDDPQDLLFGVRDAFELEQVDEDGSDLIF